MNKEALKKSIQKDGYKTKVLIAIEECAELQHTLTKLLINDKVEYDRLKYDLADLQICIENLKIMYGITDDELLTQINKIIKINEVD